jgi:rhodanese-related sulfurtransferase
MKKRIMKFIFLTGILFFTIVCQGQTAVNWTKEQLMEPSVLANDITTKKDMPVIISVGPGATIPNSLPIGMVNDAEGLHSLEKSLRSLPKGKKIVIYCGCCPFENCPNVRPAIKALKEMNFTNYFLLNLPQNIKKDWIDKGYPVSK